MVSASERYRKKRATVNGLSMAYVEVGKGDPIVFLHGNPTSSYLWRNIIPHLEDLGRCIAPDLIGMGDSDKLSDSGPDSYTFVQHREYLDALLDQLGITRDVTLVLHDWGSGLGFDWAYRQQNSVKGIVYMEAIVRSSRMADLAEELQQMFQALRSPAGDQMVLERNLFVEKMLPDMVMRKLTDDEMAVYRRPYLEPGESRRPTLTWPRQISFDGEPEEVHDIIERYSTWLLGSRVPKLFVDAEPGLIMAQDGHREYARSFSNQQVITVKGAHFIQEDCPDEIGEAIASWLRSL